MTTQNQSAHDLGNDQTNTETAEKLNLGAPATSTAFTVLFEAAAPHLSQGELEYLTRMDEQAALQTQSLASSLMTLGCFYYNIETGSEPSNDSVAEQFWNLSHQLDHIHGLIELAGNAAHRLKNPKTETPQA